MVEVPAFQGPLDLLLHLIQQEKVDIYDIPVAWIADQFVQAMLAMEALDMEITSEFLVLAAQLLYLKSLSLLPKPPKQADNGEEEDPRRELVERLVAYRAFKEAALELGNRESSSGQRFFHQVDIESILATLPAPDPLDGVDFSDLLKAFLSVIERAKAGEEVTRVQPDEIPVQVMADDVLRRVLLYPEGLRFRHLLRAGSRMELVVTFLALLELLKDGKIRAEQAAPRAEIFLIATDLARQFGEQEQSAGDNL